MNRCPDCNKNISKTSTHCASCAKLSSRNPNFKKGESLENYHCIDCGKEIKYKTWKYGRKRCHSCENRTRKYSKATKQKISQIRIKKGLAKGKNNPMFGIHRFGENSSMFDKHHTKKTKEKMSKIRIKKELSKGKNNPNFGKPAPHGKGAYYKGIWMRSSYEILFAQFLDLSGIKYQYEPERFYFKDCTYCPDFYLPEFNLYIEIKGWWRPNTKKRFDLFEKNYPNKNIKVLMKPDLQTIGVL